MQTVTVTIGRNVPTRHQDAARLAGLIPLYTGKRAYALNDDAWQAFTDQVIDQLKFWESQVDGLESTWVETHDGVGVWDGVTEESRKITLLYNAQAEDTAEDRRDLEQVLRSIRDAYYQDAVSVVWGDSTLI